VKDFVGDSPIVAHAYKNERDFLDYEFARAKVIPWGESTYADERYICTQVLFGQPFPGASRSLTSVADRLALDSSERDDRHCALLDADNSAPRWQRVRRRPLPQWPYRIFPAFGSASVPLPLDAERTGPALCAGLFVAGPVEFRADRSARAGCSNGNGSTSKNK
jgi:hypothetical protein